MQRLFGDRTDRTKARQLGRANRELVGRRRAEVEHAVRTIEARAGHGLLHQQLAVIIVRHVMLRRNASDSMVMNHGRITPMSNVEL